MNNDILKEIRDNDEQIIKLVNRNQELYKKLADTSVNTWNNTESYTATPDRNIMNNDSTAEEIRPLTTVTEPRVSAAKFINLGDSSHQSLQKQMSTVTIESNSDVAVIGHKNSLAPPNDKEIKPRSEFNASNDKESQSEEIFRFVLPDSLTRPTNPGLKSKRSDIDFRPAKMMKSIDSDGGSKSSISRARTKNSRRKPSLNPIPAESGLDFRPELSKENQEKLDSFAKAPQRDDSLSNLLDNSSYKEFSEAKNYQESPSDHSLENATVSNSGNHETKEIASSQETEKVSKPKAPAALSSSINAANLNKKPTRIVPEKTTDRFSLLMQTEKLRVSAIKSSIKLDENEREYCAYVIIIQDIEGEMWSIEKKYDDFVELHSKLVSNLSEELICRIGHNPPSKKMFEVNHNIAPFESDKRLSDLTLYLMTILAETIQDPDDIFLFLCTDLKIASGQRKSIVYQDSIKEGYLSKRGRNFGGWKRRYFVLFAGYLSYYESQVQAARDSQGDEQKPIGKISLKGARIAKQKSRAMSQNSNSKKQYRHALMITENPDDQDSSKRNILCAENDSERDQWVYLIARQVEMIRLGIISVDDEEIVDDKTKLSQKDLEKNQNDSGSQTDLRIYAKYNSITDETQEKKQSFHQRARSRASKLVDWASSQLGKKEEELNQAKGQQILESFPPHVFGVSLSNALEYSRINDEVELPSIVYRCLEYLDHVDACAEEGIYRLSGSSTAIEKLRELFERNRDVDLKLLDPAPDVHAVAGLLKAYFRELPDSLLTPELHPQFMKIFEMSEVSDRVLELASLVSKLPLANYTLLREIIAHLITIVQNSTKNKMTSRNIGIVFSPTLGVPAGIFMIFMAEFDFIFSKTDGQNLTKARVDSVYLRSTESAQLEKSLPSPPKKSEPNSNQSIDYVHKIENKRNSRYFKPVEAPDNADSPDSSVVVSPDSSNSLNRSADENRNIPDVQQILSPLSQLKMKSEEKPERPHSKLFLLYENALDKSLKRNSQYQSSGNFFRTDDLRKVDSRKIRQSVFESNPLGI